MAQKIIRVLTSDISGKELDEKSGETVSFGLDGSTYEIDLSKDEADEFRGLFQDYIAAGRKAGRASASSARRSAGPTRSKEELAEIRTWAEANGHQVAARGRIKQEILDAFDAANQ